MIGESIRTILLDDQSVLGVIGNRVFADLGPQTSAELPYVVYRISFRSKQHTQDIAAVEDVRVEFDLYGSTYTALQQVEEVVDNALDRYPIGTIVGDYIMDGIIQDDSDDDPYDVDEDGAYKKTAYYSIRVKKLS